MDANNSIRLSSNMTASRDTELKRTELLMQLTINLEEMAKLQRSINPIKWAKWFVHLTKATRIIVRDLRTLQ